MCPSTGFTTDPADAEAKFASRNLDVTVIITMNGHATGLTAGAFEPVELKICDYIIIKIWS